MTIVTKTILNPKKDQVQSLPLVHDQDKCTVTVDVKDGNDTTGDVPKPLFGKVCGIAVINFVYVVLFLMLLGYAAYMYSAFMVQSGNTTSENFKGWAEIPMPQYQEMDSSNENVRYMTPVSEEKFNQILSQIFKEFIEIDVLNESFETISVPDFNGMKGRFIHDFYFNYTAIIDPVKNRCFIMPLNRTAVLPPKSFLDAITKIEQGYYEVDMSVVKQNYNAVFPAITNYRQYGRYIANECGSLPTYRLEKVNREIFKRSADSKHATFTQYAGKTFQEMTISNIAEVESYEQAKQ